LIIHCIQTGAGPTASHRSHFTRSLSCFIHDSSILLHRLSSWFGICDSGLIWFQSFLS
jgi:hypothetical protein